jgi:fermentation-respiration switch protein FrsA (DUF1100 family)
MCPYLQEEKIRCEQEEKMAERRDVEFPAEGGEKLRGWLFVPDGKGPFPAISMAHGYAGVKEQGIEPFAHAFTEAGFVVLLHDHLFHLLAIGLILDCARHINYKSHMPLFARGENKMRAGGENG